MQRSRRQTRVRMHLVPAQAMSLYSYFKPTLPSPSGPLAENIIPATIKAAIEAVKDATSKPSKARGNYRVHIIRIIYPLYIRACGRARALRHRVPVYDRNLKIRNFILKIFSTFSEFLAPKIPAIRYTHTCTHVYTYVYMHGTLILGYCLSVAV